MIWRAVFFATCLLVGPAHAQMSGVSPDLTPYAKSTDVPALVTSNAPVKSVTGQVGNVQIPSLCSPVTAGTAIGGTATETPFGNTCTIPANTIKAGTSVILHVGGIYSAATANAATGRVYYTNNATINPGQGAGFDTAPISTGSLTGIAGQTGLNEWWGDVWITFYSTTSMDVQSLLIFQAGATTVTVPIGNNTTFSIDPTKDLKFYLTVQWSTNNAANSMNLRTMNMK